jgi:hypothetical protein
MKAGNLILAFLLCFGIQSSYSQNQDSLVYSINGYIKALHGVIESPFLPGSSYLLDNLIHNRINFEARYGTLHFNASIRNRLFWGGQVQLAPNFADNIESANNDKFDLSYHLAEGDDWLINSNLDRLNLQYSVGSLEMTVGRQRINWGIHTFWNPHDLFNTYSFVDFDYEERPGSDAVNLTYYQGYSGQFDLAVKYFDNWSEAILAGRYKFNIGTYDIQTIAGYFHEDLVIGLGWAGNIKNGGFKGEMSYFLPLEEDDEETFVASLGGDYVFNNGLYLGTGFLYNSAGVSSSSLTSLFLFELSPKSLYPYEWSFYVSGQKQIGSLSNGSLTVVYSPVTTHPMFIVASLGHSLAENWDTDLTLQMALEEFGTYRSTSRVIYFRVKWSF